MINDWTSINWHQLSLPFTMSLKAVFRKKDVLSSACITFCINLKRPKTPKTRSTNHSFLLQKSLISRVFKILARCCPFINEASLNTSSKQMLAIAVFLLFQTTTTRAQESLQAVLETVHNSILLDDTPFAEITTDSWTSCSRQCARDKRCKSANFIKSEKMCFLMNKTQRTHPILFLRQLNTIHLHKVWEIILKMNVI